MGSIKPQVYFNFNHQLLPSLNICADNLRMNKIGLKIKAALTSKGLTQMSLAEKVGVSNNAVTKWIKTGKVAKDNIPKIAKILDMSITDFFADNDDEIMHVLYLLQDPKLKAILLAAEPLAEYKKDALLQTSIALAEQPRQNGTK